MFSLPLLFFFFKTRISNTFSTLGFRVPLSIIEIHAKRDNFTLFLPKLPFLGGFSWREVVILIDIGTTFMNTFRVQEL